MERQHIWSPQIPHPMFLQNQKNIRKTLQTTQTKSFLISWHKGEACLDRSRWHEFLAKGFSCHPCVWMRYEGGPVLPLLVARACELLPMLDWNLGQVSVVPVPYKVCLHTLMFFWWQRQFKQVAFFFGWNEGTSPVVFSHFDPAEAETVVFTA